MLGEVLLPPPVVCSGAIDFAAFVAVWNIAPVPACSPSSVGNHGFASLALCMIPLLLPIPAGVGG